MKFLILAFPIAIIAYFVLSIILYNKRKTILNHYNDSFGYISSFIFAAFIITPFTIGVPMYMFEEEMKLLAPFSLIYCIPAIVWYLFKLRKTPKGNKFGLFWAMLGIGLCAPMFIVYYCITEFFKNAATSSSSETYNNGSPSHIIPETTTRFTNVTGNAAGYVYQDGRMTNESGQTIGYIYKDGRMTNASGQTTGYIYKDGRVSNESGQTIGYIYKDGRVTNASGQTIGYTYDN
ncbi:MAG: 5-fold beta-flower protein [Hominilimicola sp.]